MPEGGTLWFNDDLGAARPFAPFQEFMRNVGRQFDVDARAHLPVFTPGREPTEIDATIETFIGPSFQQAGDIIRGLAELTDGDGARVHELALFLDQVENDNATGAGWMRSDGGGTPH